MVLGKGILDSLILKLTVLGSGVLNSVMSMLILGCWAILYLDHNIYIKTTLE